MINLRDNPHVHRFDHQAMNTTFSVRALHVDRERAADAAIACFARLDELEDRLSRYRSSSDVSQINAMHTGQSLLITADTHACLLAAMQAAADTEGLFDITLGVPIEHLKTKAPGTPAPPAGTLRIAPDRPAVDCLEAGRGIDLGGIGKGFAVQQMARLLSDWGIESSLVSSGASTLCATGPDHWPVELHGAQQRQSLALNNNTLSASGTAIQGSHLVHPDHPQHLTGLHRHVWVVGHDAALVDAYATACMLMSESQIRAFVSACPGATHAYLERPDSALVDLRS